MCRGVRGGGGGVTYDKVINCFLVCDIFSGVDVFTDLHVVIIIAMCYCEVSVGVECLFLYIYLLV